MSQSFFARVFLSVFNARYSDCCVIAFCTCFLEHFCKCVAGILKLCIFLVFSRFKLTWYRAWLFTYFVVYFDDLAYFYTTQLARLCADFRFIEFFLVFLIVFMSITWRHIECTCSMGVWKYSFSRVFRALLVVLHVFSRLFWLLAGWLAGYGWAGWLAARWLPGWWVWFSRDVSRILHSLAKGGASVTSLHVFSRGICIFALMAQSRIVVFVILHVFSRAFLQIWLLEHWNITFSSCFLVENGPATKLDFSRVFLCLLTILLIFIAFSLITSAWILVLLCFPSVFECFCEVLWTLSWRHFARMFSMGVRKY